MQKSAPTSKRALAEQLWLAYYNHELLARGVITEAAYRRMAAKIHARNKNHSER